ncbi:MAG: hypothetical protein ACOVOV_17665, partial [Dolichospermum sp.]
NTTGILAHGGYADKFYFNSVNLNGQFCNSSSGLVAAFANGDQTLTTVTTNIDVRNNIFAVTGSSGSAGGNFWAYHTQATTTSGSTINYNVLYCAGTNGTNNIGRFNSTNYSVAGGLAAWQTAVSQDANSLTTDPMFTSSTDLHVNSGLTATGLESGGVAIGGISTDYDGDTRPGPTGSVNGGATAPDIGADEFDGVPLSPCTTPSAQPTSLSVNATGQTTIAGSFTAASPAPSGYLVVRTTSSSLAANPVDATTYTVGTNTFFGTGGFVQSVGTSTSISSTGLTAGTTYYYWIFSYNSGTCTGCPKYLNTSPLAVITTTGVLFTSIATGNWEDGSTWNQYGAVPNSTIYVVFAAGHTVNVN